MRGIIFTTFNDFVEDKYGYIVLDKVLLNDDYPNKGGFSTGVAYCPSLLVRLIEDLSQFTEKRVDELWFDFGVYAFSALHNRFSQIYSNPGNPIFSRNTFEFVENLNIIHFDELKKLYPNANFPKFDITRIGNELSLIYKSNLKLHQFVKGLLYGCVLHFNEPINIESSIHYAGKLNEYAKFVLCKGV